MLSLTRVSHGNNGRRNSWRWKKVHSATMRPNNFATRVLRVRNTVMKKNDLLKNLRPSSSNLIASFKATSLHIWNCSHLRLKLRNTKIAFNCPLVCKIYHNLFVRNSFHLFFHLRIYGKKFEEFIIGFN